LLPVERQSAGPNFTFRLSTAEKGRAAVLPVPSPIRPR
jgi:hypothetical protein